MPRFVQRLRSIAELRFSALDFKVGLRMLGRHPGLSVVGTVAVAVAIALGTIYFEAVDKFRNPRLPIRDADRVVSILNWNAKGIEPDSRLLNDFASWRKDLHKVTDLGAAITFQRNLETENRNIEPVYGAEVTATAFTIMRTPPLLGRTLTARDELAGEPPVVVLSHSVWTRRFAGDSRVVGKAVKLGSVTATIVGVMPKGFAFPVSHKIWTPLRQDGSLIAPGTGPSVRVFGLLASGVSLGEAQAELAVFGARVASSYPETHKDLRPRVVPYEKPLLEGGEAGFIGRLMYLANTIFLMLLTIVCTNVATLVFARTATRKWEITVRNALGASRGRIIAQLFIEALVLVGGATVVGLFVARVAMGYGLAMLATSDTVPFWFNATLSWKTIVYAGFLTVFAAAIIGILPALRVTRGNLHDAMRSQGSGAGLRFGWFWTTVIVVQVAITVAFMPLAAGGIFESNRFKDRAAGIGADRFLTAGVALDREDHALDSAAFAARARLSISALEQRLAAEPGVEGLAFSDRLPVEDQFKYRID
ncbi:MAG: ABC transporter permease, partial [Gemmatimonadota bacterium]|nr:ABC transporter permease [Gemmatimonadota bacterium]